MISRISLLAPILTLLGSCRDSTEPISAPLQVEPAPQLARSSNEIVVFDDAIERIIPAMGDQEAGLQLQSFLVEFAAAYGAGDEAKARRAVTAARKVLAQLDAVEHPANLTAIRLSLLRAESLLISAEDNQPPGS
jgi:hypothetical protein